MSDDRSVGTKPAPDAVREAVEAFILTLRENGLIVSRAAFDAVEKVRAALAPPVPSPDGPITTEQLDQLQFGRTLHKRSSPDGAGEPDLEQVFIDICNELSCPYDNEAALIAIDLLKDRAKANAAPPVRADREAIKSILVEMIQRQSSKLVVVDYEATIDRLLSLDVQPGAGERELHAIAHDGFVGNIIGRYTTREGKAGAVLQQIGTRVVHVYGEKWLSRQPPQSSSEGEQR